MKPHLLHDIKKNAAQLMLTCLILFSIFPIIMSAVITKTYTSTLTNTSTITLTKEKEGTIIDTIVKTLIGPKIQETTFATYTTITTETVIQSITYQYTTSTGFSPIDKDQWQTIYYHSHVRKYVSVTITTPIRVKTVATGLTTLTESTVTSYLTEYELDIFTNTILETSVNTKTFKTIILEETVSEETGRFPDFPNEYGIIILALIILALAFIPKKILKKSHRR